jgi:hypothetical protein
MSYRTMRTATPVLLVLLLGGGLASASGDAEESVAVLQAIHGELSKVYAARTRIEIEPDVIWVYRPDGTDTIHLHQGNAMAAQRNGRKIEVDEVMKPALLLAVQQLDAQFGLPRMSAAFSVGPRSRKTVRAQVESRKGPSKRGLYLTANNAWLASSWQTMGTAFKHEVQLLRGGAGHEFHTEIDGRPYRVEQRSTPYRMKEGWLGFRDKKPGRHRKQ